MKYKILVVEDNAIDRLVIQNQLKNFEAESHLVDTAEEALKILLNDETFTLLLVDWNLSGMTGLEFVQSVRASHKGKIIKIVMVTGETGTEHIDSAISVGVDEYIMKPITRSIFSEKMKMIGLQTLPA